MCRMFYLPKDYVCHISRDNTVWHIQKLFEGMGSIKETIFTRCSQYTKYWFKCFIFNPHCHPGGKLYYFQCHLKDDETEGQEVHIVNYELSWLIFEDRKTSCWSPLANRSFSDDGNVPIPTVPTGGSCGNWTRIGMANVTEELNFYCI